MDEFKISLFEKEYNLSFPAYRELTETEGRQMERKISERYDINLQSFAVNLQSKQIFPGIDSMEGFKLKDTLAKIGIIPTEKVFINWYRFEKIDAFEIDDLDKYFYDIWFPGADDIDIFDENLSWILSIRHDGAISYVKDKFPL